MNIILTPRQLCCFWVFVGFALASACVMADNLVTAWRTPHSDLQMVTWCEVFLNTQGVECDEANGDD